MSRNNEPGPSQITRGVPSRGRGGRAQPIQSPERSAPASRSLIPVSSSGRVVTRTSSGSIPRGVSSSSRAHASILQSARQVGIQGGTFNTAGTQQFNITLNLGDQGREEEPQEHLDEPSRYQGAYGARQDHHEALPNSYEDYGSTTRYQNLIVQRSSDIYYRLIAVKGRGSPLWIPGSNQSLEIGYQRQGTGIGDVGIITVAGSFDFLFNIFLPPDHPYNPPELPENFTPFPFSPLDVQKHREFDDDSYLSSASVKKSRTGGLSGLTFESSASEGAILTMPIGSNSEDIASTVRLRNYITTHAQPWYDYIVGVRGREIQNGDVRLVTGWDKSKAWGMATFTNTSAQQEPFLLQFKPIERGNAGRTYGWEYSGSAEVRSGPGAQEKVRIRMGDPSLDGVEYENQCLFIRTLNVTLQDHLWTKLATEFGLQEIYGGQSNTYDTPYSRSSREGSTSATGSSTSAAQSFSAAEHGGRMATVVAGSTSEDSPTPKPTNSVVFSPLKTSLSEHPSKGINKMLLELNPTARMAITEDKDWTAVLREDDTILPPAEQLFDRIMASNVVCIEQDTVFLQSREADRAVAPLEIGHNLNLEARDDIGNDTKDPTKISSKAPPMADAPSSLSHFDSFLGSPLLTSVTPTSPTADETENQKPWSSQGLPEEVVTENVYPPRRSDGKKPASAVQNIPFEKTRQAVANAVSSVLGTVDNEDLLAGIEYSNMSPVPELSLAARTLLNIWGCVQKVDMNVFRCLRLTERCADILLSVRQEVHDAGDESAAELAIPLVKLEEAFVHIHHFMVKQNNRSWLKKYIRRDEFMADIARAESMLNDVITLFAVSIQTRVIKNAIPKLDHLHQTQPFVPTNDALSILEAIQTTQNSQDTANDSSDLRQRMQAAIQTANDSDLLQILQVTRQEIPDTVKTLQRALEDLVDQEQDASQSNAVERRVSEEINENVVYTQKRSESVVSTDSSLSDASLGDDSGIAMKDTLGQEFIEAGIDALRRLDRGGETLPSWTITKFEIDRDQKIGIGFFSDTYRGTWRGKTVAIKVLAETTPRNLFLREVAIWKSLRHPNVLPLYGASSATGDPPWFLVSPYLNNGTLVEHLKRIDIVDKTAGLVVDSSAASLTVHDNSSDAATKALHQDADEVQHGWDLLRFMHEIAKGMQYLHGQGVLHGDLRASKVLVDNKYKCLIFDFGLSEMKWESSRISGITPHGTLRWQPPELLAGRSHLTAEVDVWAFSISCVEILSMGKLPWPFMDDNAVRDLVLKEDQRPPIPKYPPFNTPGLQDILRACWQRNPQERPTFAEIAHNFESLRRSHNPQAFRLSLLEGSQSPGNPEVDAPRLLQSTGLKSDEINTSMGTQDSSRPPEYPHRESTAASANIMPVPTISLGPSDLSLKLLESNYSGGQDAMLAKDDYEPFPPTYDRIAGMNERLYRLVLSHGFHPSLVLSLWEPSPIELGDIGYLSKPKGQFVTLFSAYDPRTSDQPEIRVLPSIQGYGVVKDEKQHHPKRTVTRRALNIIDSLKHHNYSSETIVRRPSFPLKAGHKTAYLYTETTEYRYMNTLDAPKKWFQSNVDVIIRTYGHHHDIQKEDLFLITGTLRAPNYALLVSQGHPDGLARFNVYANPKIGQPWGTFSTEMEISEGPSLDSEEPGQTRLSSTKVSIHGSTPWNTVLAARLRFKPDNLQPTAR
ncbi:hypothetical protein GALMADRAFT_245167 [Galerina marginata CBS 339.88]|uniref:Protein kinase domain-containing protein n=1 Tax=Galerina marginata (strain CBS 339.88) TaxID=685588 RepID=A0A067T4T2_GALM3|nr:hypothetical protein GALMADRAFT_245167 [Galerina marginata CBS 339.88]